MPISFIMTYSSYSVQQILQKSYVSIPNYPNINTSTYLQLAPSNKQVTQPEQDPFQLEQYQKPSWNLDFKHLNQFTLYYLLTYLPIYNQFVMFSYHHCFSVMTSMHFICFCSRCLHLLFSYPVSILLIFCCLILLLCVSMCPLCLGLCILIYALRCCYCLFLTCMAVHIGKLHKDRSRISCECHRCCCLVLMIGILIFRKNSFPLNQASLIQLVNYQFITLNQIIEPFLQFLLMFRILAIAILFKISLWVTGTNSSDIFSKFIESTTKAIPALQSSHLFIENRLSTLVQQRNWNQVVSLSDQLLDSSNSYQGSFKFWFYRALGECALLKIESCAKSHFQASLHHDEKYESSIQKMKQFLDLFQKQENTEETQRADSPIQI